MTCPKDIVPTDISNGSGQVFGCVAQVCQMLMLKNAHPNDVTVFAVDKELVDQLAFNPEAKLRVDVQGF